jgi:catechol 2,3-dioxygenase-like lactoylglutathione lyase family enzyme/nitrite reductase/ring-hydroxylating ferredoxin subunit
MALVDAFSHLTVQVTDLDRSERFYQDAFGLEVIGRDLVNEIGPNSLLAMNTRQRVVLVQVPEVKPFRPNSSGIHHAWLLTPDQYDRAQVRLKEMGFDITDSRESFRAMGERSMDVFDPDGHRYQVQSYSAESKKVIVEGVGEVACGNVADYRMGAVKAFNKGKFVVVRHADGFIALSRFCTHMNGLLAWKKEHWQFYCPMHGAAYNRKGECTTIGREGLPPLRMHPLFIAADGGITVRPDESIVREGFDPSQLTPFKEA